MATEYATLVFRADTSGLETAENSLSAVARTSGRTQKSVNEVSTSAMAAGKSFRGMGRNAAQAGLNIQKIIGPADQGAGSLMQFSNRAAGAGAAAGKTGVDLSGMGRKAGQAGIQVQQLVGQVSMGTSPMQALSMQATDLGFVLGFPLAGAVAGITAAFAGPLIAALVGTGDEMDELTSDIDAMIGKLDEFTEAQRAAAALAVAEDLRKQRKEYEQTEARLEALSDRLDEASDNTRSLFNNMRPEEMQELRDEITTTRGALDTQGQSVSDLEEQYRILTGEQEASSESQKNAAEDAERLVERLQEQADTLRLNREQTILYKAAQMDLTDEQLRAIEVNARRIQQYYDEEEARKEAEQQQRIADREAKRAEVEREREAEAAIKELRQQGLIDREENELQSIQRRRAKLEQFRQDELISEKQYNEASKNLERETQDAKVAIVGDTLNALGAINEDAFKVAKAFNIANAVMNTYTGATKALATYPPPFNFIAAAGVVASGLAQVSQIRSQTYSGRALGGQVRAGESYVVGERGPEVLTMGGSGSITPNEAIRNAPATQTNNQTTNVTFEISTIDARGFDQLLQSRRGQIISIINSASNDRGRRAVV